MRTKILLFRTRLQEIYQKPSNPTVRRINVDLPHFSILPEPQIEFKDEHYKITKTAYPKDQGDPSITEFSFLFG